MQLPTLTLVCRVCGQEHRPLPQDSTCLYVNNGVFAYHKPTDRFVWVCEEHIPLVTEEGPITFVPDWS